MFFQFFEGAFHKFISLYTSYYFIVYEQYTLADARGGVAAMVAMAPPQWGKKKLIIEFIPKKQNFSEEKKLNNCTL